MYNLDEMNINDHDKFTQKRAVKKAVKLIAREELLDEMKTYKKIKYDKNSEDEFEFKPYLKSLTLERAKMKFSLESHMVNKFKFNYMSDIGNESCNWAYDFCKKSKNKNSPDSIENYAELRLKYDLSIDNDFTDYIIKIVQLRNNLSSVTEIKK